MGAGFAVVVTAAPQDADSADAVSAPSPEQLSGAALEAELERRARLLAEQQARLAALRTELTDQRQRRDALYQELEQTERDIAALAAASRQLTEMVEERQQAVAALEQRLRTTTEELRSARDELATLLRSAYAMGRGSGLRLLLERDGTARNGRLFGYYRGLGRVRVARIESVRRLSAQLTDLRTEAAGEAERLRRLAERQGQTLMRLRTVQAAREAVAAELDVTIAAQHDRMAALDRDVAALRGLIERLHRRVQIAAEIALDYEHIASRKGRLAWPVPHARLAARFQRAGDAAAELHADGVLIATETGTEVRAVHHGRVVYADWLRGFGMLLVIDHGDGYMSLYGHNQALLTEVGEWVETGDVIALSGSTGGSDERGLYFAIRHQGAPLDPERWCAKDRS